MFSGLYGRLLLVCFGLAYFATDVFIHTSAPLLPGVFHRLVYVSCAC